MCTLGLFADGTNTTEPREKMNYQLHAVKSLSRGSSLLFVFLATLLLSAWQPALNAQTATLVHRQTGLLSRGICHF
jgi:hypothetical protein